MMRVPRRKAMLPTIFLLVNMVAVKTWKEIAILLRCAMVALLR
jgi:hypothetical protein